MALLPGMASYYLTYGEPPPRRFEWWRVLAVLAVILLAGAIVGAIWMAVAGDDSRDDASSADPSAEAVPFTAAIPAAYAPGTNTVYVVDLSGSIGEAGHLDAIKLALSTPARPDSSARVENSRAALMVFGDEAEAETVIELSLLSDETEQAHRLTQVDGLEATTAGGSFIYDAVDSAYRKLGRTPDDGRANVIVVLSDGIDGGVGECPIASDDVQTEYCVGDSGDPAPCSDLNPRGGMTEICEAIPSVTDPGELLRNLARDELTTHTNAYGSANAHQWLKRVAEITGGT